MGGWRRFLNVQARWGKPGGARPRQDCCSRPPPHFVPSILRVRLECGICLASVGVRSWRTRLVGADGGGFGSPSAQLAASGTTAVECYCPITPFMLPVPSHIRRGQTGPSGRSTISWCFCQEPADNGCLLAMLAAYYACLKGGLKIPPNV